VAEMLLNVQWESLSYKIIAGRTQGFRLNLQVINNYLWVNIQLI
jgi:hypothetical protein